MTIKTKTALKTAGALLALALVFLGVQSALAVEDGLYEVSGNPSCDDLYQATIISGPDSDLSGLGPLFGIKYDENPTGDVSNNLTNNGDWKLVKETPEDLINSVSIFNVQLKDGTEGIEFDWSATLGIDAIIVKGGPNSNAYVYIPEKTSAEHLTTSDGSAISHIDFCYDYELTAEKTANAEYTRTYTWSIAKSVEPNSHTGWFGDEFTATYDVFVDQTVVDSDFKVTGEIIVSNPTPFEVTFSVDDYVDGTMATVNCLDGYTLAAGESTTCTYEATLDGAFDGTNTATITSENSNVKGAEATADYTFGEPTTIVGDPTINVTDYFDGDTIGKALGSASGDFTFEYDRNFACPTDEAEYTEGVYTDSFPNTAEIDETGQSDDANVDLTCYMPLVEKDADTEWFKEYTWTITKEVDPESHVGFIGDSFTSSYDVTVDQTISDYGYRAFGSIYVTNPSGEIITVDVADAVNGTTATVDCDGAGATSLTISAGATASCDYTVDLADNTNLTNTATVTITNGSEFQAVANVIFGNPIIVGFPTINVTDYFDGDQVGQDLGPASGYFTFEYDRTFVCPTDEGMYTDGVYTDSFPNTAEINETEQSDDANVDLNCYAPLISKDAYGSYDEYHDWTVEKSVDPTLQSKFAGETAEFDWTVVVEETVTDQDFEVHGQITVINPAPIPMEVNLIDVLGDGTPAAITSCTNSGVSWNSITSILSIPAGVTAVCDYQAYPTTGPGLYTFGAELPETVQFSVQYPSAGDTSYFKATVIGEPLSGEYDAWCIDTDHVTYQGTNYTANVYSSYDDLTGLVEYPQNMDLVNWIINQGFVGTTSPGGFGIYTYGDVQRAIWTLIEDQNSIAGLGAWNSNRVNEIVTAAETEGEGFTPDCDDYIAVVLEPVSDTQVIAIAQVSIIELGLECPAGNTVTATLNEIDFTATAEIDWTRNILHESVTLDDDQNNRWPIDLVDGDSFTYPDSYTCEAASSDKYSNGVYQYSEYNLATIKDGDQSLAEDDATTVVDCYIPADAKVVKTTTEGDEDIGQFPFTFELYDPSDTLVETQTLGTGGGTIEFAAQLKAEGTWTVKEILPVGWVSTTALTCTFDVAYPDSADETYTCTFDNVEMSRFDLLKLTKGSPNESQIWNFAIYAGPDGFGGTAVTSDSTPPPYLDFGYVNLNKFATYTICEKEVPAGWSSIWYLDNGSVPGEIDLDDTVVMPYNPNADDDTPEDVGNRCVDIGAGTEIPLVPGETLHFIVDNNEGGNPRTPGYWKNWNTCTGGGQQYTAAANGGWVEGFWLLDDVLDPTIGGGIVWDDILVDNIIFDIDSCYKAVDILDKREVGDYDKKNPTVWVPGKKKASDPLINLATHLLAAQLNFGAGACTTQEVLDKALEAEKLLDKHDFDGTAGLLPKKTDDGRYANELADYLDRYNNGEFCGDFAP